MTAHIRSYVPGVAIALVVTFGGAAVPEPAASASDDCIAAPIASPPQGSHWYYRTDRVKNRKCWFVGPDGLKLDHAALPPQALGQAEPAADATAPTAHHADSNSAAPAPTQQSASFDPTATQQPTAQRWPAEEGSGARQTEAVAPQIPDPRLLWTDVVARVPTSSGVATAQPAPTSEPQTAEAQESDAQPEVQVASLVVDTPQSGDSATLTPMRVLLFIAGVLAAAAAFVRSAAVKLPALAWWPKFADRRASSRRNTSAPGRRSRVDVVEAPPLQPAGRAERPPEGEELLRQLLRDLERTGVIKVHEKRKRPLKTSLQTSPR